MTRKRVFDSDEGTSEYELLEDNMPTDEEQEDAVQDILDEYEEEKPAPVAKPNRGVLPKPTPKGQAYSLTTQETDIMSAAIVQLEQAKLYDMFLKHNLFEGVKANPTALKRVETELKGFILERMQILLGLKQPKAVVQQVQQVKVENQFNDVEADFLKALAFKGTRGESAKATTKSEIRTLKPMAETPQTGLKSLAQQYSEPEEEEIEEVQEEEEPEYVAPVRRPVRKPAPAAKVAQTQVRKQAAPSTVEEIAREDLKRMAKRKPAHEMTDGELAEANRNIDANRGKRPSNAMPMPSPDQMASHYMTQQIQNSNSGNNSNNQLLNILSSKMGFSTNSVQQVGDDD